MTAENRGDNDASTLQYLAEHVFNQSADYDTANKLATAFVMNLKPQRVIKLANDAARDEARYVDGHRDRFAYPEIEKFHYAWQQLNFIVPFFQMIDENQGVTAGELPLLTHFGQKVFRFKGDDQIVAYSGGLELDGQQVKEVQQLAQTCQNPDEQMMYKRYCKSIKSFIQVIKAYHAHYQDDEVGQPDLTMSLRIFFNYVRVLRNNYFHGGYSAEDFLIKNTNNQQEIAEIAKILTEYNRIMINHYAGELSQNQRNRAVDQLTW